MQCPTCETVVAPDAHACDCGYMFRTVPDASDTAPLKAPTGKPKAKTGGTGKGRKPIHRLNFHGQGGTLLGMMLVNWFLTACTLGIYSFWGKVKVRKYTHSQLEFRKERFAYHGTGKELFLGWLKGAAIFGAAMIPGYALMFSSKEPAAMALGFLLLVAAQVVLLPLAIVGSLKYRMSRTSWQNIRFSFRGDAKALIKLFVPNALLTLVTCGLYFPYFQAKLYNYVVDHTYFGSQQFRATAQGKDIFKDYVIALVLHLPTLGIIWLFNQAKMARYFAQHTTFGRARFRSSVTAGGLFKLWFVNALLVMFSFGLAFPWVVVRNIRYNVETLALVGDLDLASITQDARLGSAVGEELSDLMEVDLGIGF